MKVKDLQKVFDGTIWIMLTSLKIIKASSTSKYDEYENESICIDDDDNSLDVYLKKESKDEK